MIVTGRRFGKTTAALEKCLLEANKPKAQIWYVAPTYRQAKQIAWKMLREFLEGWPDCKWNETELSVTIPNETTISLKGADNPDSLRGVGLNFVVLDEYSDIHPEVWQEIIRPTLADTKGGAWFIGTPKGHNHFFELWKAADSHEAGDDWKAYKLRTEDNPYIPKEEIEAARKGDERIYRQEWLAEFTAFAGKFFTEFDDRIHAFDPFPIHQWYRKIIAVDYGYTAPSCALWIAIDGDANIIVYKEIYARGLTYDRLAEEIVKNSNNERIEVCIADPSIWAKEGTIGESGAERLQQYLAQRGIPLLKADNTRKIGWGQVREVMKVGMGPFGVSSSRLKIFKTCSNLLDELPSAVYMETDPEDCEAENDHALDALRYGIMYLTRMRKADLPMSPLDKRIHELSTGLITVNPNKMYTL